MEHLQDDFGGNLRPLTLVLLLKLAEQIDQYEKNIEIRDEDVARAELAQSYPELAHRYEQLTELQLRDATRQAAMVEAIAYGILWALDNHIP